MTDESQPGNTEDTDTNTDDLKGWSTAEEITKGVRGANPEDLEQMVDKGVLQHKHVDGTDYYRASRDIFKQFKGRLM